MEGRIENMGELSEGGGNGGKMLGKCKSLKLVKKIDEVKKKRKKTVTFLKRRHC